MDPDFFMIYEDADLSFRAQLRGYGCVYVPGAIVYHRYRVTIGKAPSRQVFYSQRNIEFVYLKNMPLGLILRSAPQRLLYEVGAAIYFSKQGTGSAFFRAKLDVLKRLPSILRKRSEIQKRRTITNSQMRAILRKVVIFQQVEEASLGLDHARSIGDRGFRALGTSGRRSEAIRLVSGTCTMGRISNKIDELRTFHEGIRGPRACKSELRPGA